MGTVEGVGGTCVLLAGRGVMKEGRGMGEIFRDAPLWTVVIGKVWCKGLERQWKL